MTAAAEKQPPTERRAVVKLTGNASAVDLELLAITLSRILVARTLEEMGVVANDEQ